MRRGWVALWAALALLVMGGGLASAAFANGATVEVARAFDGPYEIMVGALPNPPEEGFVHLTVTVTDRATTRPVTDAQVTAFVRREGETQPTRAELFNSPSSLEHYDRNVAVAIAGLYFFTVEVDGSQGQGRIEFPLEVEQQAQSLSARLVWIGIVGVVLLGAVYVWWSIHRSMKRKRLQP